MHSRSPRSRHSSYRDKMRSNSFKRSERSSRGQKVAGDRDFKNDTGDDQQDETKYLKNDDHDERRGASEHGAGSVTHNQNGHDDVHVRDAAAEVVDSH